MNKLSTMGSKGHVFHCDWWISIHFVGFCFSRACWLPMDKYLNNDWWQQKTQPLVAIGNSESTGYWIDTKVWHWDANKQNFKFLWHYLFCYANWWLYLLNAWSKFWRVTMKMKATGQYYSLVLNFNILCKIRLVQDGSNFWVCGWNPEVWPLQWKLLISLTSTFLWCSLSYLVQGGSMCMEFWSQWMKC